MDESGYVFKDRRLKGPYAMATYHTIYLDVDRILRDFENKMIAYIILHEMGHMKRINKMGKDHIIEMLSTTDFDEFISHIIYEEITADRYSSMVFKKLKGKVFPQEYTQQLHIPSRREDYKYVAEKLFGVIKDEASYNHHLKSFIIEEKVLDDVMDMGEFTMACMELNLPTDIGVKLILELSENTKKYNNKEIIKELLVENVDIDTYISLINKLEL